MLRRSIWFLLELWIKMVERMKIKIWTAHGTLHLMILSLSHNASTLEDTRSLIMLTVWRPKSIMLSRNSYVVRFDESILRTDTSKWWNVTLGGISNFSCFCLFYFRENEAIRGSQYPKYDRRRAMASSWLHHQNPRQLGNRWCYIYCWRICCAWWHNAGGWVGGYLRVLVSIAAIFFLSASIHPQTLLTKG